MLRYLDLLIGLATIMLLVSMIVMAITHFIMTVLKLRSRSLRMCLTGLLGQIDPALKDKVGEQIVKALLSLDHVKSVYGAANAVHREEFIKAILHLADEPGFAQAGVLKAALQRAGIDDPQRTLDGIHSVALELERQNPELATNMRYNIAIMQQAESKFVSRVHAWFDRAVDRASERYKIHSRMWTFAIALAVALFLQLDTVQVVNRLALDDVLRTAMVDQAKTLTKPDSVSTVSQQQQPSDLAKDRDAVNYANATLTKFGLVTISNGRAGWVSQWQQEVADRGLLAKLVGLLLSTVLLSLGAPFWYSALSSLLRLRSAVQEKDDEQRAARSSQPDAATATAAANEAMTPRWMRGEQGNPQLVG